MKKFVAFLLAFVLCLSLCACGGKEPQSTEPNDVPGNVGEVVEPEETPTGPAEEEPTVPVEEEPAEVETPNYAEIVPGELQGVWLSLGVEGVLTFYAYLDHTISTFVVNPGLGAADALSGTFSVGEETVDYLFGGHSGHSKFTYLDGTLEMTDANGAALTKQTDTQLMEYLVQEEACENHAGVICLAELIQNYYPDSAESSAAQEKKAAAEAAIKAHGEAALATLTTTYDKVQHLTWYESKSQPQYVDICCYIYPYIGRLDDGTTWLRVKLNYTDAPTDAGWLFFDNVIFSIDGENTQKYFSRDQIIRDNDTEVWETADYEPDASDIEVLRKIAASTETIIRFQGDEYYYDHTVTAKEKTAILNVLDAYNYLVNYFE